MAGLSTNFRPVLKKGRWELTKLRVVASVAGEEGSAWYANLTGEVDLMTGTQTNFRGILAEAITSSDADYATDGKMKYFYVPKSPEAEAEFTVGAGTFTAGGDVGKVVALNDSKSVAVDTAGLVFRITKFISSTRGVGCFNTGFSQT